jgi:hypothetical protein
MSTAKPTRRTRTTQQEPVAPQRAPRAARKPAAERMSLREAMQALEGAGTAQARKTYLRHGAEEPLFGVSFAALKGLVKNSCSPAPSCADADPLAKRKDWAEDARRGSAARSPAGPHSAESSASRPGRARGRAS